MRIRSPWRAAQQQTFPRFPLQSPVRFTDTGRTCMAPSTAMSALTAALKTEDLSPRAAVVNMQTSLEDSGKPKVAILPFSVEALMADRKPSREASSPDSAAGTSQALEKGARIASFGGLDTSGSALPTSSPFSVGEIMNMSEDVMIKAESPDSKERTSWIQSPRFSPTSPSKFLPNAAPKKFLCVLLCLVFKFGQTCWTREDQQVSLCWRLYWVFEIVFYSFRTVESPCLSPEKTQDEPKAPNPLHHVPAARPGEEVPAEAVPFHRGARRVLQLPQPNGDSGQNLVPESEGQSQEVARGRAGKTENGSEAHAASSLRDIISTGCARPRVLRGLAPVPEALAAGVSGGTLRRARGIQYVPPRLTGIRDVRDRDCFGGWGVGALTHLADRVTSVGWGGGGVRPPHGTPHEDLESTSLDLDSKFTHCENDRTSSVMWPQVWINESKENSDEMVFVVQRRETFLAVWVIEKWQYGRGTGPCRARPLRKSGGAPVRDWCAPSVRTLRPGCEGARVSRCGGLSGEAELKEPQQLFF